MATTEKAEHLPVYEVRDMLKTEISKLIDYTTTNMPRVSKNRAVNELLSLYENEQEWNEDLMTTGASVDEIKDWLNSSVIAEEALETIYEVARITSDNIMQGLGFEWNAITDAFDACITTIEGVRKYAQAHGYDDDVEKLTLAYNGRTTNECFVDAVKDNFVMNDAGFTDSLIACCFDTTESMLNETRLCQELDVTFVGYAGSCGGLWHLECAEGTYFDFENDMDEIFDRLSGLKQETKKKPASMFDLGCFGIYPGSIENACEACESIIQDVKDFAVNLGYDTDREILSFDFSGEVLYELKDVIKVDDITNSIIAACFEVTKSTLEGTGICKDFEITFDSYTNCDDSHLYVVHDGLTVEYNETGDINGLLNEILSDHLRYIICDRLSNYEVYDFSEEQACELREHIKQGLENGEFDDDDIVACYGNWEITGTIADMVDDFISDQKDAERRPSVERD